MANFSTRQGLAPVYPPISTRSVAPSRLRKQVVVAALNSELSTKKLRSIVCVQLQKAPNRDNNSNSKMSREVNDLLLYCDWNLVFDIIEDIASVLSPPSYFFSPMLHNELKSNRATFHKMINRVLQQEGIGLQLVDGKVTFRGEEPFEAIAHKAPSQLEDAGLPTAGNHLREAIRDLSKRPTPDLTGALHHSYAALECVARAVSGDEKLTPGDFVKRHYGEIPPPLDKAVEKLWGFASDKGRHSREGQEPNLAEVQLAVHVAASVATYLSIRFKESK